MAESPDFHKENSSYCVSPKEKNVCVACGKDARLRCGKCRNVYYCDKECQLANWKSHKLTCVPKQTTTKPNTDIKDTNKTGIDKIITANNSRINKLKPLAKREIRELEDADLDQLNIITKDYYNDFIEALCYHIKLNDDEALHIILEMRECGDHCAVQIEIINRCAHSECNVINDFIHSNDRYTRFAKMLEQQSMKRCYDKVSRKYNFERHVKHRDLIYGVISTLDNTIKLVNKL